LAQEIPIVFCRGFPRQSDLCLTNQSDRATQHGRVPRHWSELGSGAQL